MTEALLLWAAEKILLPAANSTVGRVGQAAPRWLHQLRSFVRVKRLEFEVTDDELQILRFIAGRQYDYRSIEEALVGRLEGEELLLAVTELQVLGLLSAPQLQQPPHPDALFTVGGDADAVLRARVPKSKPVRPRRRDIPESITRRKRAAANADWLMQYETRTRNADYVPAESIDEASRRRQEVQDDQQWLAAHGL